MPNRELCKALNEDVHEASKKGMVWEELVTHKSKYSFQQPHTQIPGKGVQGALDGVGSESRRHTAQVSED